MRITIACALVIATGLGGAGSLSAASASTLFARNATDVKLSVSADGNRALVTYDVDGKQKHTLVFGAVNALAPSATAPQVEFTIDYTGGLKRVPGKKVCRTVVRRGKHVRVCSRSKPRVVLPFQNSCRPYDGPELAFLVVACKAPDGSYWAIQRWQYWLPFFGFQPWLDYQDDWALHISHWSGPIASLELYADWIDTGQGPAAPHNLFGRLTYGGTPVYGFVVKPGGVPGDGYGRVVYVETYDSAFGAGWWRETGILTRNPSGVFCHALVPLKPYSNYPNQNITPAGTGTKYRAYVEGPGVTPLVMAEVADPGNFDPSDPAKVAHENETNAIIDRYAADAPACLRH